MARGQGRWLPIGEVSRGIGHRLAAPPTAEGESPQGFDYGELLTLFSGQISLPLLATDFSPSGIGSDAGYRAAIAQVWDPSLGLWVNLCSYGPKIWRQVGSGDWEDVTPAGFDGKVYQFFQSHANAAGLANDSTVIASCGRSYPMMYSEDGGLRWQIVYSAHTPDHYQFSWAAWDQWDANGEETYACVIGGNQDATSGLTMLRLNPMITVSYGSPASPISGTNVVVQEANSHGAILLGYESPGRAVLASGNLIWILGVNNRIFEPECERYRLSFPISCGASYGDQIVIAGDYAGAFLWKENRPLIPLGPSSDEGCPTAFGGRILSLFNYEDRIFALWERTTGYTQVLCYNPDRGGAWQPVSKAIATEVPSGTQQLACIQQYTGGAVLASYGSANVDSDATADSTNYESQSFQFAAYQRIAGVRLWLKSSGTAGQCQIRSDDGTGKPSSTVLMSSFVPADYVKTTYSWVSFAFEPVDYLFAPTTTYHIVLLGAVGANWGYDSTGGYADGQRCRSVLEVWTAWAAHDHAFQIVGEQAISPWMELLLLTDTGVEASLWRQDYPLPALNPVLNSASQYELGPLYHIGPWYTTNPVSDIKTAIRRVQEFAQRLSATEKIMLDYQLDFDEAMAWRRLATFSGPRESIEAAIYREKFRAIRLRLGMCGAGGTATPVLHGGGVLVEPSGAEPEVRTT